MTHRYTGPMGRRLEGNLPRAHEVQGTARLLVQQCIDQIKYNGGWGQAARQLALRDGTVVHATVIQNLRGIQPIVRVEIFAPQGGGCTPVELLCRSGLYLQTGQQGLFVDEVTGAETPQAMFFDNTIQTWVKFEQVPPNFPSNPYVLSISDRTHHDRDVGANWVEPFSGSYAYGNGYTFQYFLQDAACFCYGSIQPGGRVIVIGGHKAQCGKAIVPPEDIDFRALLDAQGWGKRLEWGTWTAFAGGKSYKVAHGFPLGYTAQYTTNVSFPLIINNELVIFDVPDISSESYWFIDAGGVLSIADIRGDGRKALLLVTSYNLAMRYIGRYTKELIAVIEIDVVDRTVSFVFDGYDGGGLSNYISSPIYYEDDPVQDIHEPDTELRWYIPEMIVVSWDNSTWKYTSDAYEPTRPVSTYYAPPGVVIPFVAVPTEDRTEHRREFSRVVQTAFYSDVGVVEPVYLETLLEYDEVNSAPTTDIIIEGYMKWARLTNIAGPCTKNPYGHEWAELGYPHTNPELDITYTRRIVRATTINSEISYRLYSSKGEITGNITATISEPERVETARIWFFPLEETYTFRSDVPSHSDCVFGCTEGTWINNNPRSALYGEYLPCAHVNPAIRQKYDLNGDILEFPHLVNKKQNPIPKLLYSIDTDQIQVQIVPSVLVSGDMFSNAPFVLSTNPEPPPTITQLEFDLLADGFHSSGDEYRSPFTVRPYIENYKMFPSPAPSMGWMWDIGLVWDINESFVDVFGGKNAQMTTYMFDSWQDNDAVTTIYKSPVLTPDGVKGEGMHFTAPKLDTLAAFPWLEGDDYADYPTNLRKYHEHRQCGSYNPVNKKLIYNMNHPAHWTGVFDPEPDPETDPWPDVVMGEEELPKLDDIDWQEGSP